MFFLLSVAALSDKEFVKCRFPEEILLSCLCVVQSRSVLCNAEVLFSMLEVKVTVCEGYLRTRSYLVHSIPC